LYLRGVDRFRGVVVRGKQLGRQLGFPTANIAVSSGEPGVYAARVLIDGQWRRAMANIDPRGVLEVHVFDFEGDLYGQEIEVELTKFIRPMQKFASQEELQQAIEKDRLIIMSYEL
jgi:FAD synthase